MKASSQNWTKDLVSVAHGASREITDLLREVAKTGEWEARRSGGSHIRLKHSTGGFASCALTPSDWRTIQNIRRDLRAAARTERRH